MSLRILLFGLCSATLAGFHSDVLLHFLFPHGSVALVIAGQLAKADDWRLLHDIIKVWLVVTWAQLITRIEQKVLLLVELGNFSWDAHRAQIHPIHILLVLAGAG